MISTALTIAGSDPSGGAGIQADLKTFAAFKVYGMAVIAALTAQNTTGVHQVLEIPDSFVGAQIDAVLSDISPDAVKTGMLYSDVVVRLVARKLQEYRVQRVVVDPVMVSSSGTLLVQSVGIEALRRDLLPLAELVTPNLAEASEISGIDVRAVADMEQAARRIHGMGARNVLVKGGHLVGDALDVFFNGTEIVHLRSERIHTSNLHGTGCVLSAAITSNLALGRALLESISFAKEFVTAAIRGSLSLGKGVGPIDPFAAP